MANASQFVIKDDVAAGVNLSFVPIPGGGSAACQQSDGVDACAIYAAGCIGGCTGKAAETLAAFAGCFEGTFTEHNCYPERAPPCVTSSGLNQSAYDECSADPSGPARQAVDAWIATVPDPRGYPYVTLDGVRASVGRADMMAAALCKAGVQAAC